MAPSAPLPLPPPMPSPAFLGAEPDHPSNGHNLPSLAKYPTKSNLKSSSSPSSSQAPHTSQTGNGAMDPGTRITRTPDPYEKSEAGPEQGADGDSSEREKRESKVQWNDSHGKELTQVWEFEASDTGDSEDDDDDADSSQTCTCVIQ